MQPLEPHSPAVSVIVPTFNRRESLLRLLASLDRQTLSIERFEVVVVDNNSSDETAAEVASFARSSRARIRCLTERVQGAAYARNRGIRESTAPVVASTDDDVEADPQWLEQAMRGLETSSAAVVGGRTVPVWDGSLPEWWLPQYEKVFFKDLGADARPVVPPDYFYTHNLVVRREPLLRVGLFDTRLAPTGRRHLVGEDVELCRRIHEDGNALYYFPPAIVRHHVEADRLSRPFLRRRYFYSGMSHALQSTIRGQRPNLLYHLKLLVLTVGGWVRASDSANRFERELALWRELGHIRYRLAAGGSATHQASAPRP